MLIVFNYWKHVMNHPHAILCRKRQRAIAARLKDGHSVDQLKLAIDGCKASPWHQGKNDRHQVYDDIELICRDTQHVESFVARRADTMAQQLELTAWINEGTCLEGVYRYPVFDYSRPFSRNQLFFINPRGQGRHYKAISVRRLGVRR